MNNNNGTPLWMPKGSGRLIIALGIVFAGLGYVFLTREFPGELMILMGMVTAFYFGTKAGSEAPEQQGEVVYKVDFEEKKK